MTDTEAAKIAAEAETRLDLTERWNLLCGADPLDCDYDDYIERMEHSGFMEIVPVDEEALESAFAEERGICPGGMMYRLTEKGLAVRAYLTGASDNA